MTGRTPERFRDRRASTSGQALVELALILPVLLLILLAGADLARLFSSGVTISSAARAGALEAAENPTSFQAGQPCSAVTNRVMCAVMTESRGASVAIGPADVTLACTPSPCSEALGSEIRLEIVGRFRLLTPVLAVFTGGEEIDLYASAAAQIAVRPVIAASSPAPGATPTPAPTATPAPTVTPTPTPTGSPDPGATPAPSSTASPTPSATPSCFSPVADFTFSPSSGKKKRTDFQFTDLSTTAPGCPLAWSWNFGDGAGTASLSTAQDPIHQYQAQGVYTITLVVSNGAGSDSRSRSVTVTP